MVGAVGEGIHRALAFEARVPSSCDRQVAEGSDLAHAEMAFVAATVVSVPSGGSIVVAGSAIVGISGGTADEVVAAEVQLVSGLVELLPLPTR